MISLKASTKPNVRMFKTLLVLLLIVAVAYAGKYQGFKIYEVTLQTAEERDYLDLLQKDETNFEFMRLGRRLGQKAKLLVSPEGDAGFRSHLEKLGSRYELVASDAENVFEAEINENRKMRLLHPNGLVKGRNVTERYYSHEEINAYVEDLAKRYPTRVFVKTYGKSYEGRLLKVLTITNGDGRLNKNVVLMDGGFHANEWISPATVLYTIDQLVEHFSANSELLKDYDWVILPVVNPDGYEFTQTSPAHRMWRKTMQPSGNGCVGTDPNRNFDFHWNEDGASDDPCTRIYAGPSAFSEPETIVVRDLIHSYKHRGIFYLTVHSYGSMILHPWGWTEDLPDTWEDLNEVAKVGAEAIEAFRGNEWEYGSSTTVLYVAAGASDDYAFNEGFPISFTMELRGGGYGHDIPANEIESFVEEAWVGIRAMALRVTEKYPWKYQKPSA